MALTPLTVENETTVVITGNNAATDLFVSSKAEIGRYRFRVVRLVSTAGVAGETVTLTGITPTATGTETQTLWTGILTAAISVDQTSFPDECEFRGRIQIASTSAGTLAATLFIHHG